MSTFSNILAITKKIIFRRKTGHYFIILAYFEIFQIFLIVLSRSEIREATLIYHIY